tara:strand:+ start:181 stop:642 length:462 start_codon:yes stop_codon:yes gene_type:complete
MATKKDVEKFVSSQESIHLYKKMQDALTEVLLNLPDGDYKKVTKNLHIMSLQEGIIGQGMVFNNPKGKFSIVSIVYVPKMPMNVLKFIIAHELGHIHLGRHKLRRGEEEWSLEEYANKMASRWGFPVTKEIWEWIKNHMNNFGIKLPKDFPES